MTARTELTPQVIHSLAEGYQYFGVESLFLPKPEHKPLEEVVSEVADRMGIERPHILIYQGNRKLAVAHLHEQGAILLHEKAADIFSPQELKAFIAHELDHHTKTQLSFRMDAARGKLQKQRGKSAVIQKAMQLFSDFVEFAADSRGAALYGADAMSRASQKLLIAIAEDDIDVRAMLFPDQPPESVPAIGNEQIAERVEAMASGAYQPSNQLLQQQCRRFERLRNTTIER